MPFQLINPTQWEIIQDLVFRLPNLNTPTLTAELSALIRRIHQDIPEKRRISTGRYSIVKALGKELYPLLLEKEMSPFELAANILASSQEDGFVQALALKLLTEQALDMGDFCGVEVFFEAAASSENWILRECASGLVRPLIKAFPDQVRAWFLELVRSPNPKLRRFVSESLRPVVENHWFHKQPAYALDIIAHLFQEAVPYPRTSVGNSLSDWMRVDQDTAWPILERLVENGDPNSYWIAYRACRNLVKQEPNRVLDLLKIDQYSYKSSIYKRSDYPQKI